MLLRELSPLSLLTAWSWILLLLLLWFLSVCLYAIYNIYFHPLAKFPGPKLYAAFRLTYIYHYSLGNGPFIVKRLHDQYGPVVRIAPDELAFISGQAWPDIYGLLPGRRQNLKDPLNFMPPEGGTADIILADNVEHARIRKSLATSFSAKALEDQQPLLNRYIDMMISQLKKRIANVTEKQDLVAWFNWATFDLTGELAFGEGFGCIENADWHPWVSNLFGGIKFAFIIAQLDRYGVWSAIQPILPKSAYKVRNMMIDYTKDLVDRRLERGMDEKRPDFFHFMLRENSDTQMSMDELYSNAFVLVVAGSETTATLLVGLIWYLLKAPEKLEKVVSETRKAFKDQSEITTHTLQNDDMPYLNATIQESLRIFPPAPTGMSRRIVEKEGLPVAGHWVPPNTSVSVFPYAAHRSSDNWTRPEEFLPERWLPENKEEFANDDIDSFNAFSYGPRNCLGKNLAYAEMRLILAKILWNFDLELAPENGDWMGRNKAFMVWEKGPLIVKMKEVER